jgi:hypothetical protein
MGLTGSHGVAAGFLGRGSKERDDEFCGRVSQGMDEVALFSKEWISTYIRRPKHHS